MTNPNPDPSAIADYLAELAGEMLLTQWQLDAGDPLPPAAPGESWAEVIASDHKYQATVRISTSILADDDADRVRYVIVHELVHLHLEGIWRTLQNAVQLDVGTIVWNVLRGVIGHEIELAVDQIARAWAPSLPYPHWLDLTTTEPVRSDGWVDGETPFTLTDGPGTVTLVADPEPSSPRSAPRSVLLNGRHVYLSTDETVATYERICELAGLDPATGPTVTWRDRPSNQAGTLVAGELLGFTPGLVIDAVHTTRA